MAKLDWLTSRPIAHRGLHDATAGIIENTASAFSRAIRAGYGIECDVQVSRDGEAFVYHDDALGRLTQSDARLADLSAAEIKTVRFKATSDAMFTLGDLCDLVAGRTPLVVEIKSRFDGDMRLAQRVATVLGAYRGPAAAMSFDPVVVAALRTIAPGLPRGIVAERHFDHPEWAALPAARKRQMAWFTHAWQTRPQFVAYSVGDLPAAAPLIARALFRLPLLIWTVRSNEQAAHALRFADQIIFEGFRPSTPPVPAINQRDDD